MKKSNQSNSMTAEKKFYAVPEISLENINFNILMCASPSEESLPDLQKIDYTNLW